MGVTALKLLDTHSWGLSLSLLVSRSLARALAHEPPAATSYTYEIIYYLEGELSGAGIELPRPYKSGGRKVAPRSMNPCIVYTLKHRIVHGTCRVLLAGLPVQHTRSTRIYTYTPLKKLTAHRVQPPFIFVSPSGNIISCQ